MTVTTSSDRPFGVHFRMAKWKSVVLLIAILVTFILAQLLLHNAVVAIQGPSDPNLVELTPLAIASSGVSTGLAALVAVVLTAWMAKVPWRTLFSHRRAFDWRRFGTYFGGSAVLVAASFVATGLIAPETTGWVGLGFGLTTLGILVVTFFFTPLQAGGEEVIFRAAIVPLAGSWARRVWPALIVGTVVSAVIFTAIHVSIEPFFVIYLFVFTTSTVAVGVITGGLEAALAFHIANNTLSGVINALLANNQVTVVDRGAEGGPNPALIILMVMNAAVVAMVWLFERRKRRLAIARGRD